MKLKHQFRDQNAEKEVEDTSQLGFFISNKAGGMLFFDASKDRTQYYARINGRTIKAIHDINASTRVSGVNHKFHSLEVIRDRDQHEIFVPHYMNALLIHSRSEDPIQLVFELKDLAAQGNREHALNQRDGRIVIRSDESGNPSKPIFTAIHGEALQYDYTKQLNQETGHSQLVIDLFSPKMCLGISHDEADAINLANHLFNNHDKIREIQESCLSISKSFKDPEAALAYTCALNSTENMLMQEGPERASSNPFFSTAKGPHTSIAMHALLLEGEFKTAKNALMNEIALQHKMLIEGSNDFEDVAWPMLLFGKLLNNICAKGKLYSYFTSQEVKEAAVKIAQIVSVVKDAHEHKSSSLESDVLLLSMYDLAYALTKSEQYRASENELKTRSLNDIMSKLVEAKNRGHIIQDDAKAIFMASYIYPILMPNHEWIKCFDILLDSMHHTFQIFKSKINREKGDRSLNLELFGLQSLAAIVLNRLDPEHYESHINEILRASVNEVLYKGIIGRPTSSFDHSADPEKEALIEDVHLLNNALFLEMLRECA